MILSRHNELAKVAFFGTHNFADSILEAIFASGEYEITAVITQPDRPIGRHHEAVKSPVKLTAEKYHLPILQPETLKNFYTPRETSAALPANYQIPTTNLFIVCQYGLIIPKSILAIPKHGTINVHTSLLPKYRGASPIQTALMNGETETGISIMLMDEKMDRGPILAQEKITIAPRDAYPSLSEKMESVAAKLLLQTIPRYLNGAVQPQPQDETQATYCKTLTRDDGRVNWSKSATEIYNLSRGLTPWPGIWTTWEGKRLKFNTISLSPALGESGSGVSPGKVIIKNSRLFIATAQNALEILALQLEGKKSMSAEEFLRGYPNFSGAKLL